MFFFILMIHVTGDTVDLGRKIYFFAFHPKRREREQHLLPSEGMMHA
jgi:hypothetical protein